MRGHGIRAFQRVFVVGRAIRHQPTQVFFQFAPDVGADMLVNRERGRRMLDEEMQGADFDPAQFRQLPDNFTGNYMKAARARFQRYRALKPFHYQRISLILSAGRARMARSPRSTMGRWIRSGCSTIKSISSSSDNVFSASLSSW